jgi:hypothetical protein
MGLPCFGLCGLGSYLSDLLRFVRIVVRVLTEGLGWGKTTSQHGQKPIATWANYISYEYRGLASLKNLVYTLVWIPIIMMSE